ncbi:MAG TPA: TIGR03936 family radical SAM-associated protein [Phycisphaerae bacterium]|nr:TIGR03936 family radical SAM-associated protein [Phycisphaerae bacterium]HRW54761.1 TIGR03936 family radical SAM-associated protein [Phycisphaerae bacterium]
MRNRLALRYAIDGDLRFISHQDTLRMFKRAFARADLALRHSEGFNPHPRISIVLPRPVGVASKDELLIVELESATTTEAVQQRLAEQLPRGLQLLGVSELHDRDRRTPVVATYQLSVSEKEAGDARAAIAGFEAGEAWRVERASTKRGTKSIDLRAFIIDMTLNDDNVVWRQSISQDGTARVGEVLDALRLPQQDHLHLVTRTNVEYAS